MNTLCLFGSDYASPRDLHLALKRLLSLPDYYGMNADALNDCLSERSFPVNLWIMSRGSGEVSDAVSMIRAVVEDNGGMVKELPGA